MTCPSCGNEAPDTAHFCPECGRRLDDAGEEQDGPGRVEVITRVTGAALTRARLSVERVARTVVTQQQARSHLATLRSEEARLEFERADALRELGAAVYGDDAEGTETARGRVSALDERLEALREEMESVLEETRENVAQVNAELRPTVAVTRPAQPEEPDPATEPIKEPWPPPDEGDPPVPAVVPEPYPGGDEPGKDT